MTLLFPSCHTFVSFHGTAIHFQAQYLPLARLAHTLHIIDFGGLNEKIRVVLKAFASIELRFANPRINSPGSLNEVKCHVTRNFIQYGADSVDHGYFRSGV